MTSPQHQVAEHIALMRTRVAAMAAGNGTKQQLANQLNDDLQRLAELLMPAASRPPQPGDRVYQLVDADGNVLGEDPAVPHGAIPQLPATEVPCGVRRSTAEGGWERGGWYPLGYPDATGILQWPDAADAADAVSDSWVPLCQVLAAVGIDRQTMVSNTPAELASLAVDLIKGREGAANAAKLAQAIASAGTGIMADLHLHPQTRQAVRQLLRDLADMLGRE